MTVHIDAQHQLTKFVVSNLDQVGAIERGHAEAQRESAQIVVAAGLVPD